VFQSASSIYFLKKIPLLTNSNPHIMLHIHPKKRNTVVQNCKPPIAAMDLEFVKLVWLDWFTSKKEHFALSKIVPEN